MTGARTLPAIQGLRALAIVLVLVHHAKLPVPGGYLGVDVFFVISGFVITRLALSSGASFSLIQFWVRRARRLLPALALMLVVVLIASTIILSPHWPLPTTIYTARWGALGAANFALLRADYDYFTPPVHNPLLHIWSLGVEEQFYVVFGGLVALCVWFAKRSGRQAWPAVAAVSAICLVASLTVRAWAPGHVGPHWVFYHPVPRAWEFVVGCLVAAAWRRPLSNRWFALAGTALVATAAALPAQQARAGEVIVLAVVGTALLIMGATEERGPIGQVLRSRVAGWIGDRSYAIYLWHWPLIVLTAALGGGRWAVYGAAAASIPLSAATYRWWENPIRRRQLPMPRSLLAPAGSILVALLVVYGADHAMARINTGPLKVMDRQINGFDFKTTDCQIYTPLPERNLAPCTFDGESRRRPIILLGDSNAGQYNSAVYRAGKELNRVTILATTPGCPLVVLKPASDAVCDDSALQALRWLKDQPPSIVIVSSANWVGADSAPRWTAGVTRTYDYIEQQGHLVVHVMSLPHFADTDYRWQPTNCTFMAIHRDPRRCGRTASRASLEAPWRAGLEAEAAAVAESRVSSLDLDPVVCPRGMCRTNVGNRWIFRDGTHITERESKRLTPYFVRALRDLP